MTLTESRPSDELTGGCRVTVLSDRCAGCQECLVRCPTGAIGIDPERWVVVADDRACVGCRQCERTCPFSAIKVHGAAITTERRPVRLSHPADLFGDTSEIRRGFASLGEAMAEASRCLNCPDPTCVRGCPAHNNIPAFVEAVAAGDLHGAYGILRATTVMPDVCSRVCDQSTQCEGACSWSLAGAMPVAIGALERFVADSVGTPPLEVDSSMGEGMSIGIVGSGPAGMGAAFELLAAGADVTVYEADDHPGGLLRWGIPDFTLPAAVAERPWSTLLEAGAKLRCGVTISAGSLDDLASRHDAVIVAHGAGVALSLAVPGADLPGVEDATGFLHRAKNALDDGGRLDDLIGRQGQVATVLVLGAGNTAMDVARSAVRLGAWAVCVDWMDRRFAPVRPDELAEAESEGVEVRFSTTLTRLEAGEGGRVGHAVLGRTTQKEAGVRPEIIKGAESTVEVDLVIAAMGYRNDPEFVAALPGTPVRKVTDGVADRRWQASGILSDRRSTFAHGRPVGRMALGREVTLADSAHPYRERTWVAGDALAGPSTVVEAMAQGRRAAQAILDHHPRRPAQA